MQGVGVPVVGKPPTAAPAGGLQATSIGMRCGVVVLARTLACSFFGSSGLGQWGVFEKVSSSDAQVSNSTGEAFDLDTGAVNSVNRRQMNSSEFWVVPLTAPARAGTATTTAVCPGAGALAAAPPAAGGKVAAKRSPAIAMEADLVMTIPFPAVEAVCLRLCCEVSGTLLRPRTWINVVTWRMGGQVAVRAQPADVHRVRQLPPGVDLRGDFRREQAQRLGVDGIEGHGPLGAPFVSLRQPLGEAGAGTLGLDSRRRLVLERDEAGDHRERDQDGGRSRGQLDAAVRSGKAHSAGGGEEDQAEGQRRQVEA